MKIIVLMILLIFSFSACAPNADTANVNTANSAYEWTAHGVTLIYPNQKWKLDQYALTQKSDPDVIELNPIGADENDIFIQIRDLSWSWREYDCNEAKTKLIGISLQFVASKDKVEELEIDGVPGLYMSDFKSDTTAFTSDKKITDYSTAWAGCRSNSEGKKQIFSIVAITRKALAGHELDSEAVWTRHREEIEQIIKATKFRNP